MLILLGFLVMLKLDEGDEVQEDGSSGLGGTNRGKPRSEGWEEG